MQEMTVQQYAKLRGVSSVAVTRAMNKGKKLVGVTSYRKWGRDWILIVLTDQAKKKSKDSLVIQK